MVHPVPLLPVGEMTWGQIHNDSFDCLLKGSERIGDKEVWVTTCGWLFQNEHGA